MSNISILGAFCRTLAVKWLPQIETKRFRLSSELKPRIRRYGFKDDFFPRGLLARPKDAKRIVPMPVYRPKDRWNRKRALFGQNDYIDILGDGNMNPVRIQNDVPSWLKGFRGNEYQMLIRKKQMFSKGILPRRAPKTWEKMKTRMDWLFYELNYRRRNN